MTTSPEELVSVLRRRREVVKALRDEPRTKPELTEECDVSRSTVDRSIDELAELDLCNRNFEKGYHLTTFGRRVAGLEELVEKGFEGLCEMQSADLQVSMDEPGVSGMFIDANIVRGELPVPDRPLREFCKRLRETPRLRGFTPVILQEYVDIGINRLRNDSFAIDLIISPSVNEYLSTEYSDHFDKDLAVDEVDFHEAPLPASTGLALLGDKTDSTACLLCYNEGGLEGFVESRSRLAVGWAERLYEEWRTEATQLTPA